MAVKGVGIVMVVKEGERIRDGGMNGGDRG